MMTSRCDVSLIFLQVYEEIVCLMRRFTLLPRMTSIIHIGSCIVCIKTREICMYIIVNWRKL